MTRTAGQGCEVEAWRATLLRLLERLEACAAELGRGRARQRSLVESDDGQGLLDALAHRQALLDDMARAADELAPLRDRFFASPGENPAPIRARLEAVAATAAEIAREDARDQSRLRERRDDAARRLVEVERGRGALAAYARHGSGASPDFQDREA